MTISMDKYLKEQIETLYMYMHARALRGISHSNFESEAETIPL